MTSAAEGEPDTPVPASAAAPLEPQVMRRGSRPRPEPAQHGPFIPLAIFFVAAVIWSGFQFYQLRLEQTALASLHANQENLVQQSQRVRNNLDALAAQTKRLADAGNANARLVIDELARRGITINPQGAASAPTR